MADVVYLVGNHCILQKENLRQAVLEGNKEAEKQYQDILIKHNRQVSN